MAYQVPLSSDLISSLINFIYYTGFLFFLLSMLLLGVLCICCCFRMERLSLGYIYIYIPLRYTHSLFLLLIWLFFFLDLKKKFVYWGQEDASNIKIKTLSGFNWLFFLLSNRSGILCVHIPRVPICSWHPYRGGSCGTERFLDSLGEFLLGWE